MLFDAVRNNRIDEVEVLLNQGIPIDTLDRIGLTPLMWAIKEYKNTNSEDMIRYLINRGADVNLENHGYSVLSTAAREGFINPIQLIIEAGGEINPTDVGATPLLAAILSNNPDAVELLLRSGADPNLRNKRALHPLFLTTMGTGRGPIMELLLKFGADPNVTDSRGKTPYDMCISNNECKYLLEQYQYTTQTSSSIPMLATQYAKQTPPNKHYWEWVLLRRDQQKFCEQLENVRYTGALWAMAEILDIPYNPSATKRELCRQIGARLSEGRYEETDLIWN